MRATSRDLPVASRFGPQPRHNPLVDESGDDATLPLPSGHVVQTHWPWRRLLLSGALFLQVVFIAAVVVQCRLAVHRGVGSKERQPFGSDSVQRHHDVELSAMMQAWEFWPPARLMGDEANEDVDWGKFKSNYTTIDLPEKIKNKVTLGASLFDPSAVEAGEGLGLCMIDVVQASTQLAAGGVEIAAATQACESHEIMASTGVCEAALAKSFSALLSVIAYITGAASVCAGSLDIQVDMQGTHCASMVAGFAASLTDIASTGVRMATACRTDLNSTDAQGLMPVRRRLEGQAAQPAAFTSMPLAMPGSVKYFPTARLPATRIPQTGSLPDVTPESQAIVSASCAVDVGAAMTYLARATMTLTAATRDCHKNTSGDHVGGSLCAVDIEGIIGSFSYVASYLFDAMSKCPGIREEGSLCGADISKLIGSIAGFGASSAGLYRTCSPDHWKKVTNHYKAEELGRQDMDR